MTFLKTNKIRKTEKIEKNRTCLGKYLKRLDEV